VNNNGCPKGEGPMTLRKDVLDELLDGIETQDDLFGPQGLLNCLSNSYWSGCWKVN
jgi:hypothetical protein